MNIWVPKLKIIEAELKAPRSKVRGFFRMEACDRYGVPRPGRMLEWEQLITNTGMAEMGMTSSSRGIGNAHNACAVGTGSPSFTNSSSALASQTGSRTTTNFGNPSVVADTTGSLGYRRRYSITKQFTLGAITGNLTEVGMFTGASGSNACFLDVIRDSGGSPTTFPVTSDDQLRVTHILDVYPYLDDATGSFTISGSSGSGSHDFLFRANALGTNNAGNAPNDNGGYGNRIASLLGFTGVGSMRVLRDVTSLNDVATDDRNIGTTIGDVAMSGGGDANSTTSDNITWTNTYSKTFGLADANHVNGIAAILFGTSGGSGAWPWKVLFDPVIPKFAGSTQRILTLNFSSSYSRA